MKRMRKAAVAAALVASTLTGGAIGAAVFAGSSAGAQTSPSTTAPAPANGGRAAVGPGGTFHPNEDAAHEAGESAEREAQEDAGQHPTVP